MKICFSFSIVLLISWASHVVADDWTQFRGAGGVSVGESAVPTKFDDQQNIAWKTELPGKGASGPIVVDHQVIVTSSGGADQDQLFVQSIDVLTGKIKWTQKLWATGRCYCHELSANAAPTPTTDGKQIYAFFSSNDLACLDLAGNLVWYRGLAVDHPKAGNDVGMASSPIVHDGVVVVQVECQGDSFATGLNATDGTTLWSVPRSKEAVWTSPLLLTSNTAPAMVVLQANAGFDVLDIKTGKTVFKQTGECSSISSAAVENGRLYVPLDGTTAFAITGDGRFEKIWNSSALRPSSASGVVYGNRVYALNGAGVLTAYSTSDGAAGEKLRVCEPRSIWSTPVVAADHMYFFTQNGKSHVVQLGAKPTVVHEHDFGADEVFLGSPAISDGALYVRSHKYLYKIAETN